MADITVDSDDLFALIKHCAELELEATARRSILIDLSESLRGTNFAFDYAARYQIERTQSAEDVMAKYQDVYDAFASGVNVAGKIKQLIGWLGLRGRAKN